MKDILSFVLVGITTGSVYGLAAVGLVLTYKTSGIFNFAHGAIAALSAYAFYDLRVLHGLPTPVALFVAVIVLPPLTALVMERIARGLAGAPPTAKIVATVGLQLFITGALMVRYGPEGRQFPSFLPTTSLRLFGVNLGVDQVISLVVATLGVAALFVFFRVSPLGVRMRAVVDDPDLLELAGVSAFRVRTFAWLIGCWFAAISGLLLAPYIGLDALLLTLLVVQAFGAAALGSFSNLPLTYAGGIVIGVLSALATRFIPGTSPLAGLPSSIPFLVLFAVLLLAPKRRLIEAPMRRSGHARGPLLGRTGSRVAGTVVVVLALLVPLVAGTKLPVYGSALVFVLIFQSLHLLVKTSGQVSLSHAAFVAVGGATFAHAASAGTPWLVAVAVAGLVTVPIGAMVAIPAIRLSGLFLALATFGFGLLLERIVYRSGLMFGTSGNLSAPRPAGFTSDTAFYYVLLAFAVAGFAAVAVVRRARLGRLLRAMADSPTSLATLGLAVTVTRVTVFCLSAFLAGVAGALYAAQGAYISATPFTAFVSLTWLVLLYLNISFGQAAPVAAAVGFMVIPSYITSESFQQWMPLLFGFFALVTALHESSPGRRRAVVVKEDSSTSACLSRGQARLAGHSPVRDLARAGSR